MEAKEKKMAAALAAVSAYLQQEEEVFSQKLADAMAPAPQALKWAMISNMWGQSGRQSMMQMRNLMQMKALHR